MFHLDTRDGVAAGEHLGSVAQDLEATGSIKRYGMQGGIQLQPFQAGPPGFVLERGEQASANALPRMPGIDKKHLDEAGA